MSTDKFVYRSAYTKTSTVVYLVVAALITPLINYVIELSNLSHPDWRVTILVGFTAACSILFSYDLWRRFKTYAQNEGIVLQATKSELTISRLPQNLTIPRAKIKRIVPHLFGLRFLLSSEKKKGSVSRKSESVFIPIWGDHKDIAVALRELGYPAI
jgi:hypothetical protein